MSFGACLRSAREERRLTLDQIAARTKIKRELLEDLEDDDLTRWPKYLVYRHGYLRSIADAIGIDRDQILVDFDETFPEYFPVAFDGGKRAANSPPVPSPSSPLRTLVPFLSPGAMALAVVLGVIAGALLGVVGRGTVTLATTDTNDSPVVHNGQDIALEPTIVEMAPAMAASSEDDAVRALNLTSDAVEGEVRVVSNPPDAIVTVNGIGRGRTPARIRYLPMGSYRIRVIQFGYRPRESSVTLTSDEPVRRVNVALRARMDESQPIRRGSARQITDFEHD